MLKNKSMRGCLNWTKQILRDETVCVASLCMYMFTSGILHHERWATVVTMVTVKNLASSIDLWITLVTTQVKAAQGIFNEKKCLFYKDMKLKMNKIKHGGSQGRESSRLTAIYSSQKWNESLHSSSGSRREARLESLPQNLTPRFLQSLSICNLGTLRWWETG